MLLLGFTFFLFLFLPQPTWAVESINEFNADIAISADGTFVVEERIVYVFDQERHGIIREIKTIKKNDEGKKYKINIEVLAVTDENEIPYKYTVSEKGDYLVMKVGDPEAYVSGTRVYVLTYRVSGGLLYFSDHDELYWNLTGNEWKVPIESATAIVTAEFKENKGIEEVTDLVCYTGEAGSTAQGCKKERTGEGLEFDTDFILSTGEGLTFAVSFPKGLVTENYGEFVTDYSGVWKYVLAIYLIGGYIVLPLFLFWLWYTKGRDPKVGPVVRVFDPPKNKVGRRLTPVELGALVDEVVNPRDISAEIIDLAVNKYLIIKEHPKKLVGLIAGEIEFMQGEKIHEFKNLPKHQQELIEAFGLDNKASVKLSALKDPFAKKIENFEKSIYESMVSGGFFPESPAKLRTKYFVFTILAFLAFNPLLVVMLVVLAKVMSRRTLFGAETKRYGMGIREFLASQERQLTFQEKNYLLFEKLLPYAIVFGVAKVWAEKFSDLATKYQPQWYQGSSQIYSRPYVLTSHLENSLSRVQHTYTATSSRSSTGFSSGFSGGGGSSGGGSGGGGGGSW